MKRLFHFRYPKLVFLILAIALSYSIFTTTAAREFTLGLGIFGYLGLFIAGIFLAFGFTAPFAVGFLVLLSPDNILLACLTAGLGAMLGDLFIFKLIRVSFMDEFIRLEKTKVMKETAFLIDKELGHKLKVYFLYALVGLFIMSPLPDEAGMIMLAGLTKINIRVLALMTFILHSLGIFALLLI